MTVKHLRLYGAGLWPAICAPAFGATLCRRRPRQSATCSAAPNETQDPVPPKRKHLARRILRNAKPFNTEDELARKNHWFIFVPTTCSGSKMFHWFIVSCGSRRHKPRAVTTYTIVRCRNFRSMSQFYNSVYYARREHPGATRCPPCAYAARNRFKAHARQQT